MWDKYSTVCLYFVKKRRTHVCLLIKSNDKITYYDVRRTFSLSPTAVIHLVTGYNKEHDLVGMDKTRKPLQSSTESARQYRKSYRVDPVQLGILIT